MSNINDRRPKLDDSFGLWTKEQILLLLNSNSCRLLKQPLNTATAHFFQPQKLKEMSDKEVRTVDNTGARRIKRVTLHLGTTEHHQKEFGNIKKGIEPRHETFADSLKYFYAGLFNSKEDESIQKILENKAALHLVIYNKIRLKGPRRQSKIIEHDMILAAASFSLASKSVLLNWMGVADQPFIDKADVHESDLSGTKGTCQKEYQLGTFLLCCIQKISWFFLNNCNVVVQVNNQRETGTTMFYRKNFFVACWKDDDTAHLITEQRSKHKAYLIRNEALTIMVCTVPIFLVRPWWFARTTNINLLQYVIETGVVFILQPQGRLDENRQNVNDLIQDVSKIRKLVPTVPFEIQKRILDPYPENICKKVLYGNDKEVIDIFAYSEKNSPITTKDHDQGKEHGGKSCAYLLMSLGLYGTPKYYKEIRLFFYMLFQAISIMGIGKKDSPNELFKPADINDLVDEHGYVAFQ
jgi:hypothetical protein